MKLYRKKSSVRQKVSMHPDKTPFAPGFIFALAVASLFTLLPFPAQTREKIFIGLVPEMNVFAQMHRFQPLADYLSRETGIEVQLTMLNSYGNIIERLRTAEIDAAFLGSFTGALAISQLDAIPVARPVNLDNTSTYHGHIFTRKDSNVTTAADMQGKTMVFVDRATTAGYVFPLAWLKKEGVTDYAVFFKEYFFAGSHDAVIDAVLNGKADIGAAKNTIYEQFLADNPRAGEELIIIASSAPVPSNGLCVMPRLGKETIDQLQAALLKLDQSPWGREVLNRLQAVKFVKTDAADYEPVVDMAREAEINLGAFDSPNKSGT